MWSIQYEGTMEAVARAVADTAPPSRSQSIAGHVVQRVLDPDLPAVLAPADPPHNVAEDEAHETKVFKWAQTLILQLITMLPTGMNGVRVRAAGQDDLVVMLEVEGKSLTL